MLFFKSKKAAQENEGCLASNRIMLEGKPVGYMYREAPDKSFPDSGWRFFSGDESDEYCDNPNNFKLYKLDTVAKKDPSIAAFLKAPIGSAYVKEGGRFIKE